MSLKDTLSTYWLRVQGELLPWLDDVMDGPLGPKHQLLVSILGLLRIEAFLPSWRGLIGRPPAERAALARAFVAKAVFNFPTTSLLVTMLRADKTLRRLCGWERAGEVPSESTFSRAFAEFADSALASRLQSLLGRPVDLVERGAVRNPFILAGINHAVAVGIEKFLDDDGFGVGEAGDLQRDFTAVSVAGGGRRKGESHRRARGLGQAGDQRQQHQ